VNAGAGNVEARASERSRTVRVHLFEPANGQE
jgi:hypothetical protein